MLSYSFYGASISMKSKQDITRKAKQNKFLKNYRPIAFMNIDRKNLQDNTGTSNPETCKKELYTITKWDLCQECKVGLTYQNKSA